MGHFNKTVNTIVMIQANELRIGNWVGDKKNNYHKVMHLGIEFNPDTVMPILLTLEMLGEVGFLNQAYGECVSFAYKDTPICAYWDGVEWCFKYGYDSDLTFAACEHLHQLQNLIFALTGQELNYQPL